MLEILRKRLQYDLKDRKALYKDREDCKFCEKRLQRIEDCEDCRF